MRQNWLECTTASGGTGDLTLIATNGFPLLSDWITSGVRQIRYSILEFNSNPSATNANLLLAEDGYCPLDVTGPTLKRSDTSTIVYSSWNGTALRPKMGSATTASKQGFSTSSGNIRVICSAASEDNPFLSPIVTTTASVGSGLGSSPIWSVPTVNPVSGSFNRYNIGTSGQLSYIPFVWANMGLYSQISVSILSPFTSATTSSLQLGIYEVAKNGDPGRQLANFGSVGALTAAGILTSSALSPPAFLTPGWYYLGSLPIYTGATGSCALSAASQWASAGPLGFQSSSSVIASGVNGQTVLTDPAVAPTLLISASNSGAVLNFGLK